MSHTEQVDGPEESWEEDADALIRNYLDDLAHIRYAEEQQKLDELDEQGSTT